MVSRSHTGEGAGGGDEVVKRHRALVDVEQRCSVVSLGGALGPLSPSSL